ncbi:hypothetical protein GBO17_02590 [Mycobacterium avium subsp. hominissuis]|uniref:hypothetical protein n=1 Tax=Mycobacterium avium TaxID=1764 RepID=UPI001CC4E556|nr:hypothetical protein [Mycobacterium avium]MBZ4557644.1 hypothetical protein [Mycobacterium avium subsp. hominissuis]MBZ4567384.1 hypothetical protein [Mycobacterium avium subsp. hominissuis]MBZ4586220.1 hypothetical protein [Mycobacterium avium subsp. hominissuis]MBZ4624543.1 hypothetical protein [Mycobacterium avium subsp. hominissuis]
MEKQRWATTGSWGATVVVNDNYLNVSAENVTYDELEQVSSQLTHVATALSGHGHYNQTMSVQLLLRYHDSDDTEH